MEELSSSLASSSSSLASTSRSIPSSQPENKIEDNKDTFASWNKDFYDITVTEDGYTVSKMKEEEIRLRQLIDCMSALSLPKWQTKHYNRALFTEVQEMKKLTKKDDFFVKNNYIPEHEQFNEEHPVKYVLFVGTVESVKSFDKKHYFLIKDKTGSITAIDDLKENKDICEEYYKAHQNFRDIDKKLQEKKVPTSDDKYTRNVAGAHWVLARRRMQIARCHPRKVDELIGNMVVIIGKLAEYKYKRCVYINKLAIINKSQQDWVEENLRMRKWYEKDRQEKEKDRQEKENKRREVS